MQGVCADGSGEPRPSAQRLRRSVGRESGTVWIWWPRYRFTAVGSMWWWVACSARRLVLWRPAFCCRRSSHMVGGSASVVRGF